MNGNVWYSILCISILNKNLIHMFTLQFIFHIGEEPCTELRV
jgi:hypothetical protein